MQHSCNIIVYKLDNTKREKQKQSAVSKLNNNIFITYCKSDTIDKFEDDINAVLENKYRFIYSFKKILANSFISIFSIFVLLVAFLSLAIYEDFFKKLLFQNPLIWETNDLISLFFVVIFIFGLFLVPSFMNVETSEFRNLISSWFNKDIAKYEKFKNLFENFDKKSQIKLFNFDIEDETSWLIKIVLKAILNRFGNVSLYIRADNLEKTKKILKELNISNINIKNDIIESKTNLDIRHLLSYDEEKLYYLLNLCSTFVVKPSILKNYISLEMFEYSGKDFINLESSKDNFIFGFQSFINRSFNDFHFLVQEKSQQQFFSANIKSKIPNNKELEFGQYLRNHLEDMINKFENPISFLILYYYLKDLILDEKRVIKVIEKLIYSVKKKQQYELINDFWFKIAGDMFDSKNINSFEKSKDSYYRKISIQALNDLAFIFERNGHFEQAILINEYLYEINPKKYALNISSLNERLGKFDLAYSSLPTDFKIGKSEKPTELEVKYYQRKAAFIIISQQNKDLKQEAVSALESLEEILFSHNEDNDALWLWHYYNIKANLCEWEEKYSEAIKYYQKCLSIPTLGSFEYGGTFVNMAISYRFKYMNNKKDESVIDESIRLGKIGLLLKESVGDRDEMPVVLHNFALNILIKIANNFDEALCIEALNATNKALEIVNETKSIKRLGMILIENYILKSLLNINIEDIEENLKNHLKELTKSQKEQVIGIYNEFARNNQITRLNFLENNLL